MSEYLFNLKCLCVPGVSQRPHHGIGGDHLRWSTSLFFIARAFYTVLYWMKRVVKQCSLSQPDIQWLDMLCSYTLLVSSHCFCSVQKVFDSLFNFILCALTFCLHACMHEGVKTLGTGVNRQLWCWELNLGPLVKQPLFLTTGPCLQPPYESHVWIVVCRNFIVWITYLLGSGLWSFFEKKLYTMQHQNSFYKM